MAPGIAAACSVHFEGNFSQGSSVQNGPEFFLIMGFQVSRPRRPVSLRIIKVSQHLKGLIALKQGKDFAQIHPKDPDDVRGRQKALFAGIRRLAFPLDAMDARQHAIKRRRKQRTRLLRVTVRLAQLDPGENAQAWICRPAALDRIEVALKIEYTLSASDPIGMLSEGDRRQAKLDGPTARLLHGAIGGIPGPL